MTNEEKKIWLTGQGMIARPINKEMLYNITFQNVDISLSSIQEFNQIHIRFPREDLIMLKKAIEKELGEEE